MLETKFGPLGSLVGRTFERDGMTRRISWLGILRANIHYYDRRRVEHVAPIRHFVSWLSGATEVTG